MCDSCLILKSWIRNNYKSFSFFFYVSSLAFGSSVHYFLYLCSSVSLIIKLRSLWFTQECVVVECSGEVKNIPPSPVLNFNLDYVRAPPAIFCIPLWTKITFSKEWAANTIWIKLYTQTINKTQQSGVTTTNYKTSSWSGETRNKNENEKQTGGFIFWDHHHQEHNRNSIITEELSYYVFHRSFHR